MSPEFVTSRELYEKIDHLDEKVQTQVIGILAQAADQRIETERRFGRVEKFIVGGGVVQTVVWGFVAVARPEVGSNVKAAAEAALTLLA